MGGRSISANRAAHGVGRAAKRKGVAKRAGAEGKESGSKEPQIYQLKITLKRSKPAIWRRVLIPGDFELDFVHGVIQCAMGWANTHLHDFYIQGEHYGDPAAGEELGFLDENEYRLQDVAGPKEKFLYEYDFGDDWEHEVLVEKIVPRKEGEFYPACLEGKGACPPEDCGGIWGYYSLLKILQDKSDPSHKQYRAWMGYDFDPEEFSVNAVNKELVNAFKRSLR